MEASSKRDSFKALDDYLRSRPFYRGQIIARVTHKSRKRSGLPENQAELPPFVRQFMELMGYERLFRHQWEVLKGMAGDIQEDGAPEPPRNSLMLPGREMLIATGNGSGRSSAMDLASLFYALVKARNVLIICPDANHAHWKEHQLRSRIDGKPWDFAINLCALPDFDSIDRLGTDASRSNPQIAIVTPQTLDAGILRFASDNWAPFLSVMDLVIWEDIHQYVGIYGGNVHWLARRLLRQIHTTKKDSGNSPIILASCRQVRNLENFGMSLLQSSEYSLEGASHKSIRIERSDYRDDSERTMVFWSMPFERKEVKGERGYSYNMSRVSFMEDVNLLIRCLLDWDSLKHDLPIVLLHSVVGRHDLDLHANITQSKSQQSGKRAVPATDFEGLFLRSAERERPLEVAGFHTAMATGTRASSFAIMEEYAHIGAEHREMANNVILINDHAPLSEYMARTYREDVEKAETREPSIIEGLCVAQGNRSLALRALMEALRDRPRLKSELAEDFSGFRIDDLLSDLVKKYENELNGQRTGRGREELIHRRIRHLDENRWEEEFSLGPMGIEYLKNAVPSKIDRFFTVSAETIPVIFSGSGQLSFLLDRASAGAMLYQGGFFYWRGLRLHVTDVELKNGFPAGIRIADPGQERSLLFTHKVKIPSVDRANPSLQLSFDEVAGDTEAKGAVKSWSETLQADGQRALDYAFTNIRVCEKVGCFREIPAFEYGLEDWNPLKKTNPWRTIPDAKQCRAEFKTDAMLLRFDPASVLSLDAVALNHTLKHLFKILLPLFLPYQDIELEMVLLEGCGGENHPEGEGWWVIYENTIDGGGYVEYLKTTPNIVQELLEKGLDLLLRCPCRGGCPSCLHLAGCRESLDYNEKLDKNGTMRFLGKMLRLEQEVELTARRREGPIGQAGDEAFLHEYDAKIREIYTEKMGLEFDGAPHIRFMSPGDARWANASIAGYYDASEDVIVIRPGAHLNEQVLVGILAHEVFHFWQHNHKGIVLWNDGVLSFCDREYVDNPQNIPYFGTMFREGSAQWGEVKILDFYGLRDPMQGIADTHYCQYGEGFRACKWIEDNNTMGMRALLDFFTEGRLCDSLGNEIPLAQLFVQSGVQAAVNQLYASYEGEGKLICAQISKQTTEIRIVTYFHYISEALVRNSRNPIQKLDCSQLGDVPVKIALEKAGADALAQAGLEGCGRCRAAGICTIEDACYLHSRFKDLPRSGILERVRTILCGEARENEATTSS